jgi:hypothetical protein
MLIVGVVALSASLLPAAGSFVSRDSGNSIFGDVAQAATCKSQVAGGPLYNDYNHWFFKASVATDWCWSGGHVVSRHSVPGGQVTTLGILTGWILLDSHWEYSNCVTYNGVWNHNCLTQREFNLIRLPTPEIHGQVLSVCIETRIYGDGHHHRHITEAESDACSM